MPGRTYECGCAAVYVGNLGNKRRTMMSRCPRCSRRTIVLEENRRPRWGEAEEGSAAHRARFDRELKKKIAEGRKRTREDSREKESQLLRGENRTVKGGY